MEAAHTILLIQVTPNTNVAVILLLVCLLDGI